MSTNIELKSPEEILFNAIDNHADPEKAADIVISVLCSYLTQLEQGKRPQQKGHSEYASLIQI